MKTDFKKIIAALMRRGFTEQDLVDAVQAAGIPCSQPTINRIKNGLIRTPSYDLGVCLVKLHEQSRQTLIDSMRRDVVVITKAAQAKQKRKH